jgi:hypothetical protein
MVTFQLVAAELAGKAVRRWGQTPEQEKQVSRSRSGKRAGALSRLSMERWSDGCFGEPGI